jgi:hypothetical protein
MLLFEMVGRKGGIALLAMPETASKESGETLYKMLAINAIVKLQHE